MTHWYPKWPDLRVGDVAYVWGQQRPVSRGELRSLKSRDWYRELEAQNPELAFFPHLLLEFAYQDAWDRTGKEPAWLYDVSRALRRALRVAHLIALMDDTVGILPFRRHLNFGYGVYGGGLIEDVCRSLGVYRLQDIRQLSFLHDPVMHEAAGQNHGYMFSHTRFAHSLDVMATASLIGWRLGLSVDDCKHLQAACVSHDTLTPAGGDAVKYLDPAAFDEDSHYPGLFTGNEEWKRVAARHSLSAEKMAGIVQGEGLLGQVHDLADKCAYTAVDLMAYVMGVDDETFRKNGMRAPESMLPIWKLLNRHRGPLCNLWERVTVVEGELVITDRQRFAAFLMLRALMHRGLYYNVWSRYREQMLATLLVELLYAEGALDRDTLVSMRDSELEERIGALVKHGMLPLSVSSKDLAPSVESFATRVEAEARARFVIGREPRTLCMIESYGAVSRKVVRYLVRSDDGSILPFSEACPEETAEIMAAGEDPLPAKLYTLPLSKAGSLLPEALQERLLARQKRRFGIA